MEYLRLSFILWIMSITHINAKIGYFWHITDFHYDPVLTTRGDNKRHCRTMEERGGLHRSQRRIGEYSCDSSLELIESAARYMRTKHSENVEFVLWTGDITSAQYKKNPDIQYQAIRNMTDLLSTTFSSHFVFPVLGHLDPAPSANLTNLWMHWLPSEALNTFTSGGYYTIEQSHSKLRIVALNTNLFSIRDANSVHAKRQWEWLDSILEQAVAKNEMVYIVGHTAPGSDSHRYDGYSPDSNLRYIRMVRRYAKIIAGQFFGHLHADTFRIIYDNDRPVSWALLAPSVTPHSSPARSSNPGLRLYKFDSNNGKVLDYTQYYLDLAAANKLGVTEWTTEYNLTQYYGLHEISAYTLHTLAEKLRINTPQEALVFSKYMKAYSVKQDISNPCDGACSLQHFCAITCLEQTAYRQCVEAAASALATTGTATALLPTIHYICTFVAFLHIISKQFM